MSDRVVFKVPGKAAPQGSKNAIPIIDKQGIFRGNNMIESSKEVGPWRERVHYFAEYAMRDHPKIEQPNGVSLTLLFVMHRPVSTRKTPPTPPATKRPDLDKLVRAILDALTGVCFDDDSQVVEIVTRKRLAEPDELPGVTIAIAEGTGQRG